MRKLMAVVLPLWCLSSCAAMHAITQDPIFAKDETPQKVRGPNVPEPEPVDSVEQQTAAPGPTEEAKVDAEVKEAKKPSPIKSKKASQKTVAAAQK